MTGTYEQRLIAIASAPDWTIPALDDLHASLGSLANAMAHVSSAPGWTGGAPDAPAEKFLHLCDYFLRVQRVVQTAQQAVQAANAARHQASNAQAQLPSTTIPADVHLEILAASTFVVPFFGPVAAEYAVQKYQEYLRAQREAQAHSALVNLGNALVRPTADLAQISGHFDPEPHLPEFVQPVAIPDAGWPGSGVSIGGHSLTGGGGSGPGGTGVTPRPPVIPPNHGDPGPITWPTDPVHTSVDGHMDGTSSGGGFGSGAGGGGLGAGLAGAGVGAGALAAGSKLAGKTPGTLVGGGSGLGGGMNGAGAKGNSAMMGGGGGAGGGNDKQKRSSLGLVAPKLDDDDEPSARSAAAGAGGRDQTPDH